MTLTKKASIALEAPNTHHHRRILFLSLEFNFSPFSGNGVLCRSLVSGLLNVTNEQDDDVLEIRVICAKPHPSTPNLSSDITVTHKNLIIWPVGLKKSASSKWKRLDRHGPWKEFATALCCQNNDDGNNHNNDINFRDCIEKFEPTDVVAVDWHGMLAWQAFCTTTTTNLGKTKRSLWRNDQVNVCYYNFRVYSSSSWGNGQDTRSNSSNSSSDDGVNTPNENQFYKEMEQLSCRLADGIICLSEHDKRALHRLMLQDNDVKNEMNPTRCLREQRKIREMTILPPPLRGDVCKLARGMLDSQLPEQEEGIISSSAFIKYLPEKAKKALEYVHQQQHGSTLPHQRLFLTCVSRLSPEKSPHIFVNLIQQLGGVDFLRRYCLVPILCGARSVDSYAEEVIQSFQSVCSDEESYWPCIVIDHHLGPKELAAIFSHTVLNVHPCLYDAYGMTMVESAAFGVPSVVNFGGKVGAAALLGENEGCVALDLSGMEGEMISETTDGKNDSNEGRKKCSAKKLEEILVSRIQHTATSPQWSRSCSTLAQVAKEARHRALGWDELSCCRGLIEKLNRLSNENED